MTGGAFVIYYENISRTYHTPTDSSMPRWLVTCDFPHVVDM